MTDEPPPERITLSELYAALPEYLDTAEPYDVEAGLAELNAWIDGLPEEIP